MSEGFINLLLIRTEIYEHNWRAVLFNNLHTQLNNYHVKGGPNSLKIIFYVSAFAYFLAPHQTYFVSFASVISSFPQTGSSYLQAQLQPKTSARQICCQTSCHFYVWTASCRREREGEKNWERVERKRWGSCSKPNRSIGYKRMSNKPMMNAEQPLAGGRACF